MLTIRFNRFGKKNQAQFRIVVQEHTVAPGGRHVEVLGSWNPHLKKGSFEADRVKYWIEKGAQVSDSAYNLLISQGVIEGKKRAVKIKKAPVVVEEKPAEAATPVAEAPKTEEVKELAKAE